MGARVASPHRYALFTGACYSNPMPMENPPQLNPSRRPFDKLRAQGRRPVHPLVDLAVWELLVGLPYFSFESFIAGVPLSEIGADIVGGFGLFFFLFVIPSLWAVGYFFGLPDDDHPQGLWLKNWKRFHLTDSMLNALRKDDPEDNARYHGDMWRD